MKESGTHAELLARDGLYASLYTLQLKDREAAAYARGTDPRFPSTPPGYFFPCDFIISSICLRCSGVMFSIAFLICSEASGDTTAGRAHHPFLLRVAGRDLEHRGRERLLLGLRELHRREGLGLALLARDHLHEEALGAGVLERLQERALFRRRCAA